jgi:hypothetical protein
MLSDFDLRRGLAVTAVAGLLIVGSAACGTDTGDGEPTAADPTTQSSSPTSPSASATETTSTVTPSASADPVPSPIIDKAAHAAIKDDFPALVPAGVPAGWTVVDAAYGPKGWRIEMTDAHGAEVGVVQARGELAPLVERVLGSASAESGTVNLGQYGTGRWTTYSGGTHEGLAKVLAHTAAVVYAADQETAVALAGLLLTAEDADMPEAG